MKQILLIIAVVAVGGGGKKEAVEKPTNSLFRNKNVAKSVHVDASSLAITRETGRKTEGQQRPDVFYVTGSARNITSDTLGQVEIIFKLYDQGGTELGEALDYTNQLGPNVVWHFRAPCMTSESISTNIVRATLDRLIVLENDQNHHNKNVAKSVHVDASSFAITRETGQKTEGQQGSDVFYVTGTARNITSNTLNQVEIIFKLYDQGGTELGAALDYTNQLGPNVVWNFRAPCMTSGAVSTNIFRAKLDRLIVRENGKNHPIAKAEAGDAKAQYNLGVMYYEGRGVGQDFKEAVKWFQKAANQGFAQAQSNLGLMYAKDQGLEQDFKEAVKWLQKAADQGDAKAQYSLGLMYKKGQGVEQDFKEAVKWYQNAADQGFSRAQNNLGLMYYEGQGVEQDYVTAYAWASIAATNGNNIAPRFKSKFLELKMTPAQIAKAEELVKEMVKKNPKLLK